MAKVIDSSAIIENWNEHIRVYAGPGAGKTYFLIQNIKNLINKNTKLKKHKHKKVLCITYTNVAVDEIKKRLNEYSSYAEVSTIHKFIADFIIYPYQKQLKEIIKDEFGIDVSEKIQITSQVEGLGILHGYQKEEVYEFLKEKLNMDTIPEYSVRTIGNVEIDIKNIDNDTAKIAEVNHDKTKISDDNKKAIKEFLWAVVGRLTHDEILYFGYKLVKKYHLIRYMLRINFPYILIDEFQDTSPLQTKLIQIIGTKESIVGVVGDIAQSIYGFQGAAPEFFSGFEIQNSTVCDYQILNNRRSTKEVVNFCNYLRQRGLLTQEAVLNTSTGTVEIIIDSNSDANAEKINELIEKTDSIVLTRSWVDAIKYTQNVGIEQKKLLKELYNAYYSHPSDFRQEIIEHNRINWIRALKFLITLNDATKKSSINIAIRALNFYIKTGKAFDNKENLKILINFFKFSKEFFSDVSDEESLISLFDKFNDKFDSYKDKDFLLSFKKRDEEVTKLLEYPLDDSDKDYDKKTNELLSKISYATGKKLVKEIFSDDSKYITTYQAKGAEFNSVFVALRASRFDKKKNGETANIIKVLLEPDTINEEFDRLLYVACSRAINKLYVYIEGNAGTEKQLTQSLEKWKKTNDVDCDFFKIITDLNSIKFPC